MTVTGSRGYAGEPFAWCSVMHTLLQAAGGGTRQGLCFLSISSVLPPSSVDPRLSLPWVTSSLSSFRMKFSPYACPIWSQVCCLALPRLALCLDLGPFVPKVHLDLFLPSYRPLSPGPTYVLGTFYS